MAIFRNPSRDRYTVVSNSILGDRRLSLKEIGLLVKLLSLPDNWEFSENGIMTQIYNDGLSSVRSGLKALEEHGYLTRNQLRNENGQMCGVEWIVREIPILENRISEIPISENQPQLNTNKQNTNIPNTNSTHKGSKKFVPPTVEEVRDYLNAKGITAFSAEEFVEYFEEGQWIDSRGQKVQNWKQKCLTWNNRRKGNENDTRRGVEAGTGTKESDYSSMQWGTKDSIEYFTD